MRVVDFGLAELSASSDGAARPYDGQLTRGGTPAYMSPEQARGERGDARTDQYSFCVALFDAACGVRPTGNAEADERAMHALPRWLRALLLRGLGREPAQRFPDMAMLLAALHRHRRRRWPAVGLAVVALGVAAGSGAIAQRYGAVPQRPAPSPCAEAAAGVAASWVGARPGVEAVFARSTRPFARVSFERLDQGISAYVRDLATMHTDSCEATRLRRTQPESIFKLRSDCLARRQQELRSLITLLATADDGLVEQSIKLVALLPPVSACADVSLLELSPAITDALRTRTEAIHAELATAQTLRKAGRYNDGLAVAERAVRAARELAVRPLIAEALEERARLRKQLKHVPQAEADFRAALLEAEASRHDVAVARLWSELLLLVGYWQTRPADARPLVPFARAALERIGQPTDLMGAFVSALGMIEFAAGDSAAALANQQQALVLYERAHGPSSLRLIEPLTSLGEVFQRRGEVEEMVKVIMRAFDITRAALGEEHPLTANAMGNLGVVYLEQNETARAYEYIYRALTILEHTSPGHKYLKASLLQNLGALLTVELRYAESLPFTDRGLAMGEEVFGPKSIKLCNMLLNRATALAKLGRKEEAKAAVQRAYQLALDSYGAQHPETLRIRGQLAVTARVVGECDAALRIWQSLPLVVPPQTPEQQDLLDISQLERGLCFVEKAEPAKARALLQEALKVYIHASDKLARSEALFGLARVLPVAERTRALELAAQADALLRELDSSGGEQHRKRISDWLRRTTRAGETQR